MKIQQILKQNFLLVFGKRKTKYGTTSITSHFHASIALVYLLKNNKLEFPNFYR